MLNNGEILIVRFNDNDEVSKAIKEKGYQVVPFYRGTNSFFLRCIRRLFMKYNLPFCSIWFDKRVLKNKSKNIFIFEALLNEQYLAWLSKNKKNCHMAVWYWNIVKNTIKPEIVKKYINDVWSFSRKDCELYGMRFNPAPYFSEFQYPEEEIIYDFSFVGKNKGRLESLLYWKERIESKGYSTKFCITPNSKIDKNPKYTKSMSYYEAMAISAKSKVLFDYIEVDDSGLSMRALEALFHKKKLVTNVKLIKDYDFYDPSNIFILGVDNFDEIQQFYEKDYQEIAQEVIDKYEFDRFIQRIFVDGEKNWWND